jgi:RHS repeat-associated protein
MIQEYVCDPNWPCGTELPLAREFVHGDPARYPEVVAMITHHFDPVYTANFHYLHDVLGSVIGLVDDAGELVERYTYDPYGKVFIEKWDATANGGNGAWIASTEPTSGMPNSSVGNPFTWTGHRYDAAVGLYATLYRAYSPTLGRWLQRDPIRNERDSIGTDLIGSSKLPVWTGGQFAAQEATRKLVSPSITAIAKTPIQSQYRDGLNLYQYVCDSPLNWKDPLGLEIMICTRTTDLGIGRHAYLWDTTGNKGKGQSCGMSSSSGSGDKNRDANGYPDGNEQGPGSPGAQGDDCHAVPKSKGKEACVMKSCKENANKGIWSLGVNDCHNKAENALKACGLSDKGVPHSRWEK